MQKIKLPSIQQLATLRNPSNLALAIKASALTSAVIAVYFQDLSIIFNDAVSNEATSYILLIPLLFVYLIFRKRKMLRSSIPTQNPNQTENERHIATLSGILLCITALMLYMYGSQTFTPLQYHLATLPFFTAGLFLIIFNPQTLRHAIFPTAFLAFLTPPPSDILNKVGSTLSVASTEAANAIVNFLGIRSWISSDFGTPAINIIRPDNATLSFVIDIACSGIYSLIGFLIFAALISYMVRDKTWKKIVIFAIGFPLIYLLNIIRITLIVLIGYQWGPQLALDIFHFLGGWMLIFLGTLTLLVLAEKAFKVQIFTKKTANATCNNCALQPPNQQYCPSCGRILKQSRTKFRNADATKIAAIIAMALLIAYIQAPVFALTRGPAQILIQTSNGQQGNVQLFPQIQDSTLEFISRDTEFEQLSGQDFSLVYAYQPQQEKKTVWVTLEIAETTGPLHQWEVCLVTWPQSIGSQPTVTQLDLRDITLLENPQIIARYFAFQQKSDNQTQLVLYWYESTLFDINNSTQQKHVKLSLIAYPDNPEDVPAMEEQLLPFAKAIVGYWEPLKTWNTITMLLTQNSLPLTTLTTVVLLTILIFHLIQTRGQRKVNAIVYQKLSKPNKQIIDAVQKTEKKTTPTIDNIAETYQKTTDQLISEDQLMQKLAELEKIGILKSHVTNKQDEPILIWKTQT